MSSPSVIFTNMTDGGKKSSAATATTSVTTTSSAACTSSSASARIYTGSCKLTNNKFSKILANITNSFLDTPSWNSISKASKDALCLFGQARNERKGAYHLLSAVLIAEPQWVDFFLSTSPVAASPRVEEIISDFMAAQISSKPLAPTTASDLSKPNSAATSKTSSTSASNSASKPSQSCIVLIKSHGKEAYFSKKTQTMETIRTWTAISPLEAAAWCGDNFMVRQLLKQVVTPKQKEEAAKQLQGILDRLETAKNGIYLAPFKLLIEAYKNYISQYDVLSLKDEWDKLDELWLSWVGARQRCLPTYGLQEFCSTTPFSPIPLFTAEPDRACRLYDDSNLELESLGSLFSLYKAGRVRAGGVRRSPLRVSDGAVVRVGPAGLDSSALSRLCEVRTSELGVMIKELNSVNSKEDTASANPSQIQRKPASA